MTRRGQLLGLGIILLLVVGLGALFVTRLEKVTEKVKFGPSAEARYNPRLAAVKMFERFGIKTRTVRDPEVMPAKGALVMLPSNVFLDPVRIARWRQWVSEGGILMVGLDLAAESRDKLLSGVVQVSEYQPKKAAGEEAEAAPAAAPPVDPEQEPATDEIGAEGAAEYWTFDPIFGGTAPEVRLAMRPTWVIPKRDLDRGEASYYIEEGGLVGIFAEGDGHFVILADDSIFDNERIAGVDHALFLWHLFKYFPDPPEVVVLLGDRVGLLAFLWRVAKTFLIAVLLLTLFFIWEKAPRFGPLVELKKPGQRGLRAHLQAASSFLWRHHEQAALLEPLRAEVLRRARLAIPGWPAFSPERGRAELARISRLSEAAIDAALHGQPGRDPKNFVFLVSTLETLRKAL